MSNTIPIRSGSPSQETHSVTTENFEHQLNQVRQDAAARHQSFLGQNPIALTSVNAEAKASSSDSKDIAKQQIKEDVFSSKSAPISLTDISQYNEDTTSLNRAEANHVANCQKTSVIEEDHLSVANSELREIESQLNTIAQQAERLNQRIQEGSFNDEQISSEIHEIADRALATSEETIDMLRTMDSTNFDKNELIASLRADAVSISAAIRDLPSLDSMLSVQHSIIDPLTTIRNIIGETQTAINSLKTTIETNRKANQDIDDSLKRSGSVDDSEEIIRQTSNTDVLNERLAEITNLAAYVSSFDPEHKSQRSLFVFNDTEYHSIQHGINYAIGDTQQLIVNTLDLLNDALSDDQLDHQETQQQCDLLEANKALLHQVTNRLSEPSLSSNQLTDAIITPLLGVINNLRSATQYLQSVVASTRSSYSSLTSNSSGEKNSQRVQEAEYLSTSDNSENFSVFPRMRRSPVPGFSSEQTIVRSLDESSNDRRPSSSEKKPIFDEKSDSSFSESTQTNPETNSQIRRIRTDDKQLASNDKGDGSTTATRSDASTESANTDDHF